MPLIAGYVTIVAMHFEKAPKRKASNAVSVLFLRSFVRKPLIWSNVAYWIPGFMERNRDGPRAAKKQEGRKRMKRERELENAERRVLGKR